MLKGANPTMTALISLGPVAATGAPTLTVTGGLHQGSSLVLDQPVYTLGADLAADLVLTDPGIAGLHLRLRFEGDHVAVEALGGDVLLAGNVRIPHGNGHRARLPLQLRIGTAGVSLAVPGGVEKPSDAPRKITPWIVATVLLFICAGALAVRSEAPLVPATVVADEVAPLKKPSREQAKAWLEQQLQTARLDTVKISDSNGQLSATGTFEQSQKPQWLALQQAFDQRYGQQVVLNPRVTARADAAAPRVRFQAVWFGAQPYVINDSGKRLYPGAALADNWVLERIENNQVILARGEERFTFTL